MKEQGYEPSINIRILRKFIYILKKIFFLNGDNRWSNEFIQILNPLFKIKNPLYLKKNLVFRTGHGRLFWRVKYTPTLENETNAWIANFNADDIFYDIGSNIGVYSLMTSQAIGCNTYSFEADPLNYSLQHENIHLNNLQDKINLFPIALSEKNSIREIYYKSISPGDALHSIDKPSKLISKNNLKKVKTSKIASFSLDFLVRELNLPLPQHIKLDVDGAELLILEGAIETLKSIKSLMIEIDTNSNNQIDNLLNSLGFKLDSIYKAHSFDENNCNALYIK